jgi:hypothetical protein
MRLHECRAFKTRQDSQSENAAGKLLSSIRKRLQQIKRLETLCDQGQQLDWQQEMKIAQRGFLEQARKDLERGAPPTYALTHLCLHLHLEFGVSTMYAPSRVWERSCFLASNTVCLPPLIPGVAECLEHICSSKGFDGVVRCLLIRRPCVHEHSTYVHNTHTFLSAKYDVCIVACSCRQVKATLEQRRMQAAVKNFRHHSNALSSPPPKPLPSSKRPEPRAQHPPPPEMQPSPLEAVYVAETSSRPSAAWHRRSPSPMQGGFTQLPRTLATDLCSPPTTAAAPCASSSWSSAPAPATTAAVPTVTGFPSTPLGPALPTPLPDCKPTKRAVRKGNLSLFLAGKLDHPQSPRAPPIQPPTLTTPPRPAKGPWHLSTSSADSASVMSMDAILAEGSSTLSRSSSVLHKCSMDSVPPRTTAPPRTGIKVQMSLSDFVVRTALSGGKVSALTGSAASYGKQSVAAPAEMATPCTGSSVWRRTSEATPGSLPRQQGSSMPSLSQIMQAEVNEATASQTVSAQGAGRRRVDPWGLQQRALPTAVAVPLEELFLTQKNGGVRRSRQGQWSRQEGIEIRELDAILQEEGAARSLQHATAAKCAREPARELACTETGPLPSTKSDSASREIEGLAIESVATKADPHMRERSDNEVCAAPAGGQGMGSHAHGSPATLRRRKAFRGGARQVATRGGRGRGTPPVDGMHAEGGGGGDERCSVRCGARGRHRAECHDGVERQCAVARAGGGRGTPSAAADVSQGPSSRACARRRRGGGRGGAAGRPSHAYKTPTRPVAS